MVVESDSVSLVQHQYEQRRLQILQKLLGVLWLIVKSENGVDAVLSHCVLAVLSSECVLAVVSFIISLIVSFIVISSCFVCIFHDLYFLLSVESSVTWLLCQQLLWWTLLFWQWFQRLLWVFWGMVLTIMTLLIFPLSFHSFLFN